MSSQANEPTLEQEPTPEEPSTHDEPTPKEEVGDGRDPMRAVLKGALGLGGLWARYGLMVGQAALRTSAKTLSSSAEMLGQISELVEARTRQGECADHGADQGADAASCSTR